MPEFLKDPKTYFLLATGAVLGAAVGTSIGAKRRGKKGGVLVPVLVSTAIGAVTVAGGDKLLEMRQSQAA